MIIRDIVVSIVKTDDLIIVVTVLSCGGRVTMERGTIKIKEVGALSTNIEIG